MKWSLGVLAFLIVGLACVWFLWSFYSVRYLPSDLALPLPQATSSQPQQSDHGLLDVARSPIKVQNCGRQFLLFSPPLPFQAALQTLLHALTTHRYCLVQIESEIGVAATSTADGTLIALFDRADPMQVSDPLSRTFNVFTISGQQISVENPFDGSLEPLPFYPPSSSSSRM
jgi:hypothetical protein